MALWVCQPFLTLLCAHSPDYECFLFDFASPDVIRTEYIASYGQWAAHAFSAKAWDLANSPFVTTYLPAPTAATVLVLSKLVAAVLPSSTGVSIARIASACDDKWTLHMINKGTSLLWNKHDPSLDRLLPSSQAKVLSYDEPIMQLFCTSVNQSSLAVCFLPVVLAIGCFFGMFRTSLCLSMLLIFFVQYQAVTGTFKEYLYIPITMTKTMYPTHSLLNTAYFYLAIGDRPGIEFSSLCLSDVCLCPADVCSVCCVAPAEWLNKVLNDPANANSYTSNILTGCVTLCKPWAKTMQTALVVAASSAVAGISLPSGFGF